MIELVLTAQIAIFGVLVMALMNGSRHSREQRIIREQTELAANLLAIWARQWGEPPEAVRQELNAWLARYENRRQS